MSEQPERLIPAGEASVEIIVVNSRFIATAAPVFNVDEAKAFIQRVRERYADASHNVPVFLIGHGSSVIAHCTDDGEPSGTAGRPALAILQGSGFGDIAVVITRYFGGTKLGTGGLVRAYSDSMREVLKALPRARKVATSVLAFETPYNFYEVAKLIVAEFNGVILDQDFGANVMLVTKFEREEAVRFGATIFDRSHGTITTETMEENDNDIHPIQTTSEEDAS
ncbi:MAG: YigZ family protein [Anaerolineaceae bacterium]|nr:YigZ family protein [Anaerolineaceae bacterium]